MATRAVHLHVSRYCNLACRHCYSSSGPHQTGGVDPTAVNSALRVLRAEGYEVLSLSGGEPLLFAGLEEILREAHALGYRINLVSNGAPVRGRFLEWIARYIQLTALSLDGAPETHIAIRGHPKAFTWVADAADRLAEAGACFGIAFGVSRRSLAAMPWAVDWAADRGAALVQFHPFGATGRGIEVAEELGLSATDQARAYVTAELLRSPDGPTLQIDLAPVPLLLNDRYTYRLLSDDPSFTEQPLADLVNPLVIDEAGWLHPMSYGVAPPYRLGRCDGTLPQAIASFKATGWRSVRHLLRRAFDALETERPLFADWFGHLVEVSLQYSPDPETSAPLSAIGQK
ncbi:MAG: radical SAM protein [Bacteroidetes bacterium]|jgi:MoaA/NifB/PqqE/SkfB family radical SAM enzyme|nr:radical SAM protein [Bacteroidota bacterium]